VINQASAAMINQHQIDTTIPPKKTKHNQNQNQQD
jgi:hypothetical protein